MARKNNRKKVKKYLKALQELKNLLSESNTINFDAFYKRNKVSKNLSNALKINGVLAKAKQGRKTFWEWVGGEPDEKMVIDALKTCANRNPERRNVEVTFMEIQVPKLDYELAGESGKQESEQIELHKIKDQMEQGVFPFLKDSSNRKIEPIKVEFLEEKDPITEFSGWKVSQGEKYATGLGFDEMLGLFTSLAMPKKRPCLQWMKTKEQHQKYKDSMQERFAKHNAQPSQLLIDHDVLNNALRVWGRVPQIKMLREECTELVAEINKYVDRDASCERFKTMLDEIADVTIMVRQMEILFKDHLKPRIEEKVERLRTRLERKEF